MGNGIISSEDLMTKLVNSKKVMNKVQTGNYKKGQIDEMDTSLDKINLGDFELLTESEPKISNKPTNMSIDRINNSKLPDNIKRAMIENPIIQPEISLNETMDIKMVQRAKQLMEQEGVSNMKTGLPKPNKPVTLSQQKPIVQENVNINNITSQLTPIIENIIRKVLDEKLNQLLTAQQTTSLNENLVIKVGESIFKGKITGVKSSK